MEGKGRASGDGVAGMEPEKGKEGVVYMCGYLPGALPQRAPIMTPVAVNIPETIGGSWSDVYGGGCGFAMAISESGKLITWGSTDDLGQSHLTSGKHGEAPEPFPLPTDVSIMRAAAGWAHCIAVTDNGQVYTWGWKECIPVGRVFGDPLSGSSSEKDAFDGNSSFPQEQVSPHLQRSRSSAESCRSGDEILKRRKVASAKEAAESSSSEEKLSALPCLVLMNPGVRIVNVAAGGRHSLALSDTGQVWGWGYGGEGQLGLGSRVRIVSSPHPIPCMDSSSYGDDGLALSHGSVSSEGRCFRVPGKYVKEIACGGRHSAVITDAGALLTFGWGLYGQCGQGSTDDELSPTSVTSLLGIHIRGVAAGLWHTVCTSIDGDVYAFGGNQFGQLGTGGDQAETLPRLLDTPDLENMHVTRVSCGARHTAVLTDDGKLFCWGWNRYGQLGLGDVVDRNIPSQLTIDGFTPKSVACGWWHTLFLAESPS